MFTENESPDILNSKIKKLRIELPHYTFSHSASGDSPHAFIGRERIRERIKKVIEDSPDEPGVYLIAGNRGVGKTSLISWVINETSLRTKTSFTENFKYIILLLLAVVGIHVITRFCVKIFCIDETNLLIFWLVISAIFFLILCCFNSYRFKMPQVYGFSRKICNYIKCLIYGITSAIKELSYLVNLRNPYGKTQYILKIILVVCYTQICSLFKQLFSLFFNINSLPYDITPLQAFVFYLYFVFTFILLRFVRDKLREYHRNRKNVKSVNDIIYDIESP